VRKRESLTKWIAAVGFNMAAIGQSATLRMLRISRANLS